MSTLHILNKAFTVAEFIAQAQLFAEQDSVIFIQDGCYSLHNQALLDLLATRKQRCYAIEDDLIARHVAWPNAAKLDCQAIDYQQFVSLTLACQKSISW